MADIEKDQYSNEMLAHLLDALYHQNKKMLERLDCIQHSICKNSDAKTAIAISKYLKSNFRNRSG